MNYTPLILFAAGFIGIFCHNLVALNKLNKRNDGNLDFSKYLKLERFAIMLSVCIIGLCVVFQSEIKQLELAGKWLGLAMWAIGYSAQSIVATFSGASQKFLDKIEKGQ